MSQSLQRLLQTLRQSGFARTKVTGQIGVRCDLRIWGRGRNLPGPIRSILRDPAWPFRPFRGRTWASLAHWLVLPRFGLSWSSHSANAGRRAVSAPLPFLGNLLVAWRLCAAKHPNWPRWPTHPLANPFSSCNTPCPRFLLCRRVFGGTIRPMCSEMKKNCALTAGST